MGLFRVRTDAPPLRFLLDGAERTGFAGQTVAAALLGLGETVFRHAPESGAPRAPFCLNGICFECVVEIDGARRQSCLVPLEPGMRVVRGRPG